MLVPCFPYEHHFASDFHSAAHAYTGLTAVELTIAELTAAELTTAEATEPKSILLATAGGVQLHCRTP